MRESLAGPLAFGLLVLLVTISITAFETGPSNPTSPEEIKLRLEGQDSYLYFIEAELMVKKQLPIPAEKWSHIGLDEGTGCAPLGNDIWYARGQASLPMPPKGPQDYQWEILFSVETHKPLFIKMGDFHWGDFNAALLAARRVEPAQPSATGGN